MCPAYSEDKQTETPVWSRGRLTAGSARELWVTPALKSPELPKEFQQSIFFFSFIVISWRLITLQYCSGFCYTLTWISHGFLRAKWGKEVAGYGIRWCTILWLADGETAVPPQAPGGLGLCAYGPQVVNIFLFLRVEGFSCKTTQEMCIKYCYLGTSKRS